MRKGKLRNAQDVVSIDPEVMSGAPVFHGTRVPIQTLLDHLEAGESIEVFLDDFPTVSREQAIALLELGRDAVLSALDADSA